VCHHGDAAPAKKTASGDEASDAREGRRPAARPIDGCLRTQDLHLISGIHLGYLLTCSSIQIR
jgi:hypothetical protein